MQQQREIFLKALHRLGYTFQHIKNINIEEVQQSCRGVTCSMNKLQKQFYLLRKVQTMQQNRKLIIKRINQQMNQLQRYSVNHKRTINPIIYQLLEQHQQSSQNKFNHFQSQKMKNIESVQQSNNSQQAKHRSKQRVRLSSNTSQTNRSNTSTVSKNKYKQKINLSIDIMKYRLIGRSLGRKSNKLQDKYQIKQLISIPSNHLISRLTSKKKYKFQQDDQRLKSIKNNRKNTQNKLQLTTNNKKAHFLIRKKIQQSFRDINKISYEEKMKKSQEIKRKYDNKYRKSLNISRQQRLNKLKIIELKSLKKSQIKHQELTAQKRYQDIRRNQVQYWQAKIKQEMNQIKKQVIEKRRYTQTQNKIRKKANNQQFQTILPQDCSKYRPIYTRGLY